MKNKVGAPKKSDDKKWTAKKCKRNFLISKPICDFLKEYPPQAGLKYPSQLTEHIILKSDEFKTWEKDQ